ncbi:carbohydrate binding protein with CBM6 domain [Mariniflexile fucanivorans]|uniref:Carbohydrate binding protein with CBM6 domain n=1 Tax=Mariniflexile fucanivorans TaxID=264023 RepID=A0A4R1RBT3_9FLAO|nr:family 43 glycosylhydrolase [Mariniflexile fucanivorans]TCL63169.1 carbohydrate binding protein with CBM6 domain [Mariniflexile fucanivorans]
MSVLIVFMGQFTFAQNPILRESDPDFIYVCDPSAQVFNGKVYVYGSHDQPDAVDYESMKDYAILESSDLKTWINHGVALDPQLDKGFEYAQSNMNAPDAAYKDGWYYWYFPSDITHVGVAKSRTPIGPWESAVTNEITTIFDPTVFVDDDGQAYIYGNDHWVDIGEEGSHIMGAKLKDNMIELDGPWIRLSKENVNEAVHIFKRNGIYYFSARVGAITKYWMADSPLPQYATLKGELAPNSPESPNHTSAIEFNNQWYLFYHRGDVNHGDRHRRSVCFDKMTFRKDGTIEPIVYTLDEGVEITVPVYPKRGKRNIQKKEVQGKVMDDGSVRIEAESYMTNSGTKVVKVKDEDTTKGIGTILNGDWTGYENIEFGESASPFTFRVRASTPKDGGAIVLRINSPTGTIIGNIPITSTGGWNNYKTFSTTLNRIRGSQTIYLCYTGDDGDLFNLNWFDWTPSLK